MQIDCINRGDNMARHGKMCPIRINVFFSAVTLANLRALAESKGLTVSGVVREIVMDFFNKLEAQI